MTTSVDLVYEHFYNNESVANGIPLNLITRPDASEEIYESGVINRPYFNPDAFLQSIPVQFKSKFRVLPFSEIESARQNWLIIDTSYNINATLSTNGVFQNLSEKALQKIRNLEVKLVIWHAHECPYQHNPYLPHKKPLWFLTDLNSRLKECDLPAKNVYMVVSNLNLNYQYINLQTDINLIGFNYFQQNYYNYCTKNKHTESIPQPSTAWRNKYYLCLNATPMDHRFMVVAELFARNVDTQGYISFLNRRNKDVFNYSQAHFEKFEKQFGVNYSHQTRFLNSLPMRLDIDAQGVSLDDRQLPQRFIADSYFSIITESIVSDRPPDNPLFITEKTFKPLYYLHPFLIAGCAGTLRYLKTQGYETFPEWFDESYDNEPDKRKRLFMVLKEIERICKLPGKTIHEMYINTLPKLLHNQAVFLSQKNQQINFTNLVAKITGIHEQSCNI